MLAGGYECLKPPDPPIAKLSMLSGEIFPPPVSTVSTPDRIQSSRESRWKLAPTVSDRKPSMKPKPACSSAKIWSSNRYRYLTRFNPASPPPGPPLPTARARPRERHWMARKRMAVSAFVMRLRASASVSGRCDALSLNRALSH